jgi:hypothetical protein
MRPIDPLPVIEPVPAASASRIEPMSVPDAQRDLLSRQAPRSSPAYPGPVAPLNIELPFSVLTTFLLPFSLSREKEITTRSDPHFWLTPLALTYPSPLILTRDWYSNPSRYRAFEASSTLPHPHHPAHPGPLHSPTSRPAVDETPRPP